MICQRRLKGHGAKLVGEVAQYEDKYRLATSEGEGIIVALPSS